MIHNNVGHPNSQNALLFSFFRDGSDEMGCQPKPPLPLCKPNEYSCFNGWECISKSLYCDGTFHCSDRSDETNCPTLGAKYLFFSPLVP